MGLLTFIFKAVRFRPSASTRFYLHFTLSNLSILQKQLSLIPGLFLFSKK
nr:MAG TPA: hypothetical protein [Caudoviricetes sp.]